MNRKKHSPPGWSVRAVLLTHGKSAVHIKCGSKLICGPELSDFSAYGGLTPVEQGRAMAWEMYDRGCAESRRLGEATGRLIWLISQGKDLPMKDVHDTKMDVSLDYELDREAEVYRLKATVSKPGNGNVGA